MTLMVERKELEFDLHGVETAPMAVDYRACFKVDAIVKVAQET